MHRSADTNGALFVCPNLFVSRKPSDYGLHNLVIKKDESQPDFVSLPSLWEGCRCVKSKDRATRVRHTELGTNNWLNPGIIQ